jgi:hypothetical protein
MLGSNPRRRILLLIALALGIVAVITYIYVIRSDKPESGTATHSSQPKPQHQTESRNPFFDVVGHCARGRGTLFGAGKGFTPNGRYVTIAWYPNGKPYMRISNPGHASATGNTPNWRWACERVDPPGRYEVRLVDLETAKMSNLNVFVVSP